MLGISHYVLLIWLNTFVLTLFTNLLQRHSPLREPRVLRVPLPVGHEGSRYSLGEGSECSRCAGPGEDGEGSRYAGAAGLRRALNARKRLIEADILNEAKNILYKM